MSSRDNCNDCDVDMMKGSGVVGAVSSKYGRYYDGLGICGRCSKIRYESFIVECEAIELDKEGEK